MIDLHTHSTYSDGTLAPAEIVRSAHEAGLAAVSITDHDSVDGLADGRAEAQRLGIEFVDGCELSVYEDDLQVHILGYFVDTSNPTFLTQLENLRTLRDERNDLMLLALARLGIRISSDDLLKVASSRLVTRAHIARALVNLGHCRTIQEAFDTYIGFGQPAFVPHSSISAQSCVELILSVGGFPSLAHPYSYKLSPRELNRVITLLAGYGLRGLECYYHNHTPSLTKHALEIANKNHLLPTGGSDFHGENRPGVSLGCGSGNLCVPLKVLDDMKNWR